MSRLIGSLLATAICMIPAFASAEEITADGHRLSGFLDGLQVKRLWLPGHAVEWQTGERLTTAERGANKGTHCSAFVAAAAGRLGIYILRPPHHSEHLLANAQFQWLHGDDARKHGWRAIRKPEEAQHLANHGQFVVAVFENPDHRHSGHIAIVRPAIHSEQHLHDFGPQIIQAGEHNFNSTSLADGFKHHPLAWGDRYVRFYTHAVVWKP